MRFLSVCSGIEAASVAWAPLGWKAAAFSEIAQFPRAVLKHHYPETPLHGDFTSIGEENYGTIELIVGGTPCQSFSIAGLRGGLGDDRGNLSLEFCRLIARKQPRWVVWENVPGVLSMDGGRAFAAIIGALAQLGHGVAWRVLDAQHVRVDGFPRAVPQRRRRVFVVGHLGDARCAAAVLFERESLSRNLEPSREVAAPAGSEFAPSARDGGGRDVVAFNARQNPPGSSDTVGALDTHGMSWAVAVSPRSHELSGANGARAFGFKQALGGSVGVWREISSTVCASYSAGGALKPYVLEPGRALAFEMRGRDGGARFEGPHETACALRAGSGGSSRAYVVEPWSVRRLTPRECERLQGFPDDYTLVPYRGRLASDTPRYHAIGNSMPVNVMRWIGRRIEMVEAVLAKSEQSP